MIQDIQYSGWAAEDFQEMTIFRVKQVIIGHQDNLDMEKKEMLTKNNSTVSQI